MAHFHSDNVKSSICCELAYQTSHNWIERKEEIDIFFTFLFSWICTITLKNSMVESHWCISMGLLVWFWLLPLQLNMLAKLSAGVVQCCSCIRMGRHQLDVLLVVTWQKLGYGLHFFWITCAVISIIKWQSFVYLLFPFEKLIPSGLEPREFFTTCLVISIYYIASTTLI